MSVILDIIAIVSTIILIAFSVRVYQKYTNGVCNSTKRLDGRTAIVTGGTAGMGLEIAKDFAMRGARVIICCPFQEEGINAQKVITKETGNEDVVFKLLDLASFDSVRKFTKDILKTEDRLDILINNAGVLAVANYLTADGIRFIIQVNYFGHFLLTLLLLPLLKKTGKLWETSRIVNTSSISHILGYFGIGDLSKDESWKYQCYAKSKICLVLFSHELTKKLKGDVVVNCVNPGAVGTRIYDSAGLFGDILRIASYYCFKTPWEGAQTALHVALDTKAGKISGKMFTNCKLGWAVPWAYSDTISRKLWEDSVGLVKLSNEELGKCFESL